LNAFGYDRRSALWQIEKAVRPAGELFDEAAAKREPPTATRALPRANRAQRVLRAMTPPERLMADYAGTSLTIGPHPLALRRAELVVRGVLRGSGPARWAHWRRVRGG